MESIQEISVYDPLTDTERLYIIINRGNGEFTSMFKSDWNAQQEAAELRGTL